MKVIAGIMIFLMGVVLPGVALIFAFITMMDEDLTMTTWGWVTIISVSIAAIAGAVLIYIFASLRGKPEE